MKSELTTPAPDAELADLVSKYLDNRLASGERDRLETRIRQEPAALAYLAKRLRFEAYLRETIQPQRMEVTESRRMIMEPGADGPEWSVEQQRSVRIGRPHESQNIELHRRRKRLMFSGGILLAFLTAAWFLWPRTPPPSPALRNSDFEATDLSLSPEGQTFALEDWQDVFSCPDAELVEVNRHSNGNTFAKSGKNAARLRNDAYLTQRLQYNDGSPVKAADGLALRLSGWVWTEAPDRKIEAALRVIASGRPNTIQYEACKASTTLKEAGWQHFTIELTIQGSLMREPFWVEPVGQAKPVLDLTGRELFLSIDSRSPEPIFVDDLKIESPRER